MAEHSIYLVHFLPDNLQLEGLLHDASEAYLADLPRPVKAGLPEYKAIEARVERVIAEKLVLPFPMAPEVKAADQALLKHEVFSFFGAEAVLRRFRRRVHWGRRRAGRDEPGYAERRFLDLYASWA